MTVAPGPRVAVVTGAAQGIGAAVVDALRADGLAVVGLDLRANDTGDEATAVLACDVSDPVQLRTVIDGIGERYGRIDVLVSNAALGSHTLPDDLVADEFDRVLRTNIGGCFFGAQAAARWMTAGGSIVSLSSIAGTSALGRGNLAYSISKAAIDGLTRELAVEWAPRGIRVNAVAPCQVSTPGFVPLLTDRTLDHGTVGTRMLAGIPMGRYAEPHEIAAAVAFLASPAAAFITGVVLPVDGGNLALNPGGTVGAPR
ncbi:SDR family NAD(P)-dependent oxidoreductase [Nakamurella lactea]|uniref:SDR family NAD(P)-dependent oxidoreductase n=1 Tax=Nakamurella lactea TaxID=459515 RepID=UPI0004295121|nr:SDR family NAD(P)-dependent oxidoreductase [Nakamurella lactea]